MSLFHNEKLRLSLICLLMVSVIFLVLYNPFIFGGQMYAYEDGGSDTIHQYLPHYSVETDMIWNGEGDGYNLQFGLGRYISGLLTTYLHPANWAILLFGADRLHIGLIVATYVKYVMICLFSLLYFLRLLKNEKAAVISALLWTFSSYNILWGQHYQFLSSMVGFSACMYGFQLYLEEDKKWYLVVPCMALLIGYSYYFTYIGAWFLVIYGILFLVFWKKDFLFILKKVGIFALLALLTACISADYLARSVVGFFESARTEQVTNALSLDTLFYPVYTLMCFATRLLSSNLIGVGDVFKGPVNYYEAASLSVSLLFVFSMMLLLQGKYRWRTLGIFLGCTLLLCMPMTSKLLCFTENAQRWTYLLCFLETIVIGLALTELFACENETHNKKQVFLAVLLGDGLLALMGVALVLYHYHVGGQWLDKNSCLIVAIILLVYHVAFLLLWKGKHKFCILLGLVAVELVLGNYATINQRDTITVEQWYTQMYNDGTEDVVQWIQEQDDSIYRINKTYYSVCKTDSLMQGYNGMGTYYSTNSTHLINLAQSWGYYNAGNWVGFDCFDWLANNMLGVKYIISRSEEDLSSESLELIYDDGTYCVHKNLDWSGFGYLSYEEMAESSLSEYVRDEQALLLTQYYYRTGRDDAPIAELSGRQEIDLLPYLTQVYDCQATESEAGIVISQTGIDAQLYFTVPETAGWTVAGIAVEMDAQTASVAQLYAATQETGYSEARSNAVSYESGEVSCKLANSVDQPDVLRLDPTMAEGQTLTIQSIRLILIDSDLLHQQRENAVTDMVQNDNTFTGTITNPSEADAMLCIPLIYSDFWKAEVDGEAVETVNINGGLTGIMIPAGSHTFELCYDDTIYRIGKGVAWCGIVAYAVLVVWVIRKQKNDRKSGT